MRRWTYLFILLVPLIFAASTPSWRYAMLRKAGWALVAEDPPAKSDVIVISTDALGAGILEADALVHAGYAHRVAIFDRAPSKVSLELARRGATPMDLKATSLRLLHELGIDDVQVIPPVVGTVDEGKMLQSWCVANSVHSLLFVSVPDHSRRTRRVLDRDLGQRGIQVRVRYARFAEFDPNTWWQTRAGQRVEIVESQKLLVDLLTHPF